MSQFAAHPGPMSMRSRRRPPDMEGKYVDSLDPNPGPCPTRNLIGIFPQLPSDRPACATTCRHAPPASPRWNPAHNPAKRSSSWPRGARRSAGCCSSSGLERRVHHDRNGQTSRSRLVGEKAVYSGPEKSFAHPDKESACAVREGGAHPALDRRCPIRMPPRKAIPSACADHYAVTADEP